MESSDIESSARSPTCGKQTNGVEGKPTDVKIKEEPPDHDIKDYAETTMNELLGWYGYDKVSSRDTELLNLHKYTATSGAGSDKSHPVDSESRDDESLDDLIDDDLSEDSHLTANSISDTDTAPSFVACSWCQRPGNKLFTQKTSGGVRAFCSEVCFTQCRRASFKKSKVCDWCKHVRHTVNYVDFQDGEQQLQFCCAKCLNQYKMKIFCKETQEHLKQIKDKSERASPTTSGSGDHNKILITPELWMKEAETSDKKGDEEKAPGLKSDDGFHRLFKEAKGKRDNSKRECEKAVKAKLELSPDGEYFRSKSVGSGLEVQRDSKRVNTRTSEKSTREAATPQSMCGSVSPLTNNGPAPLNPFQLNPALAGMSPWIPPQMCGSLGPGFLSQIGTLPPWCFPGMLPAFPGFPANGQMAAPVRSEGINHSPNGSRQDQPRIAGLAQEDDRLSHSPGVSRHSASRRAKLHGAPLQMQTTTSAAAQGTSANSNLVPPVTMIMPVPIALPLPIPIPLPLPLKWEEIMAVFDKNKSDKQTTEHTEEACAARDDPEPGLGPKPQHSPRKVSPGARCDFRSNDSLPSPSVTSERSCSVVSCPELAESGAHDLTVRKRPLTPKPDGSLDLSKRRRTSESDSLDSSGAIDLSKDGILSRMKNSPGKENRELNDIETSSEVDASVDSESEIKIPRIHIITPKTEPPLCQELPLPPAVEDKYSKRRGLILDAPRVPKPPKSPSPERRTYVRSIPRDVMEAARRRCLRARIRTK